MTLRARKQDPRGQAVRDVSRWRNGRPSSARQGVDVLAFGVGEPDFKTPSEHVLTSRRKEALDGWAWGATPGCAGVAIPCVEAIARDLQGPTTWAVIAHGLDEIVCLGTGAKQTLYNLAMVLLDPGDEVIIPAPYWVSYPSQVQLAGASSTVLSTTEEDGFRLTPEALRGAVNERTKALILCSPSNPTGAAYTADHLRALAEVAKDTGDFWIIVDEIYGELTYDGFEQRSLLEVAPELRDRLIVVDGVSKTFAMTGWRIGWMLGPAHVAKAVEKLQGQSTTNPTAVAQHAAVAALRGDRAPIDAMRAAFAERRRVVIDGLNAIEGITCREPEGAFYAFPNVSALVGKRANGVVIEDDLALATWLLESARCALVPGTAFGAPGFMRMSYATSMDTIREGLRRIEAAVATLD